MRECGGIAVTVTDDEIISAISLLGRTTGVFAEPAAASAIAGLKKIASSGCFSDDDVIVALITGSGLKDVPAAMTGLKIPTSIVPLVENII